MRPVFAILITTTVLAFVAGGAEAQPLQTAFTNYSTGAPPDVQFGRMTAAGAGLVRLDVNWPQIAPQTPPPDFDPSDPASPSYQWASIDAIVQAAVTAGLKPILDVVGAPVWAQNGTSPAGYGPTRPDPTKLAQFATALATRYGGTFQGLPRVSYWELLNEPNLQIYLNPQFEGGKPVSPTLYRTLTNAFAKAIHAVHASNVVVVGGLTPFTFRDAGGQRSIAPLRFMQQFLCMSAGSHPRPTCKTKVEFDVWSHHPYTSGGPTHKAANPGDVSLGDLPTMNDLLQAAVRAGHVVSKQKPAFWVTEFSWDSKPPDPKGVPLGLESRWVAEASYRMWAAGVSLFTWFSLVDQPLSSGPFQSGLYFEDGRPKPAREAFRFPVVAYPDGEKLIHVWGRTPFGKRQRVVVEQSWVGGWRRLGVVTTDRFGIFDRRFARKAAGNAGSVRARLLTTREHSAAFALRAPPDLAVNPFGTG